MVLCENSKNLWIGKNTYPFEKQNEQFWSDNVFPEGVFLKGLFPFENKFIDSFGFNLGHFKGITNVLSFGQEELIDALYIVNQNIGFVLVTGNAVEMPWLSKVKGILQTWYLGSMAGLSIADVISGDVIP